jgi:hypothetical protein
MDLDELAELTDERTFLLRSIEDLDRERAAGDIDDRDFTELRDGYVARAAAVLTAIDEQRAVMRSERRRVPVTRRLAVAGVVLVVAVGAGLLVARFSGTRLPGQTASGNSATSVSSMLAEARALLGTDNPAAIARYDEVLAVDPDQVEAITYRAWTHRALATDPIGSAALAEIRSELDRAVELDPAYADAYVFRGVVAWRDDHDAAVAVKQFDAYYALSSPPPRMAELVRGVDTEARAALGLAPRFDEPSSASTSGSASTSIAATEGSGAALRLLLDEICPGALNDALESLKGYTARLDAQSDDVKALSCRGWLRVYTGAQLGVTDSIQRGQGELARALELAPGDAGALLLDGLAGLIVGDDPLRTLGRFDAFYALPAPPPHLAEFAAPFDADAHNAAGKPKRA